MDLEETVHTVSALWSAKRMDDYRAFLHEDIHATLAEVIYPLEGREAVCATTKELWDTFDPVQVEFTNVQTRDFGTVGIVSGTMRLRLFRSPREVLETTNRATLTFLATTARWLLIAWHYSEIPDPAAELAFR